MPYSHTIGFLQDFGRSVADLSKFTLNLKHNIKKNFPQCSLLIGFDFDTVNSHSPLNKLAALYPDEHSDLEFSVKRLATGDARDFQGEVRRD